MSDLCLVRPQDISFLMTYVQCVPCVHQDRYEAALQAFNAAMEDFSALLQYFGEKPKTTFTAFFATLCEFAQVCSCCSAKHL